MKKKKPQTNSNPKKSGPKPTNPFEIKVHKVKHNVLGKKTAKDVVGNPNQKKQKVGLYFLAGAKFRVNIGVTSSCSSANSSDSTDETVIEDEEGLKSVGRLVQSEWLVQTGHMGSHFTP